MSEAQETRQIILDTAERMFGDLCDKQLLDAAEQGEFAAPLWEQIAANGFHHLGAAASGTSAADLYAFLMTCGRHAVPLPLAETLLVNNWREPDNGLYSIGIVDGDEVVDVPWGRRAEAVIAVNPATGAVCAIDTPEVVRQSVNMAGEPRDVVRLTSDAVPLEVADDPFAQLALTRANLMAGGVQALLELGITFASEREQFGRQISKFQAIQHSLAIIASEAAAARRAADAAVDALGDERFVVEVAASKARIGEAVTVAAEQVHQIHGAMGFTHEHRLHHFSRRTWAWRDEFGNEFFWQQRLGAHLANLGADKVWSFMATRG